MKYKDLQLFKHNGRLFADCRVEIHGSEAYGPDVVWKTPGTWNIVEEYTGKLEVASTEGLIPQLMFRGQKGSWFIPLRRIRTQDGWSTHVPETYLMSEIKKFIEARKFVGVTADFRQMIFRRSQCSFMDRCTPLETSSNVVATRLNVWYSMNCVHHITMGSQGWLEPYQIEDPTMQFTKVSHARKGIHGTLENPLKWFSQDIGLKVFKRFKGLLGDQVIQLNDTPILGRVEFMDLPDGVSLMSNATAKKIRLLGRDGEWHSVQTGDKVAGVMPIPGDPMGILVKATIIVTTLKKGVSIVIGNDCNKGKCTYNELTAWHFQSRAEDRVAVGKRTLSYQALQFHPTLAKSMAQKELCRPRAGAAGQMAPSLLDMLEGRCSILDYSELFCFYHHENGVSRIEMSRPGLDIIERCSIVGHEDDIKDKLRGLLDSCFNPPVKAAWLVCVPSSLDRPDPTTPLTRQDELISIPKSVWEKLGKPVSVMFTRFPIKGSSSLLRMDVIVHEDSENVIKISSKLMKTVVNGDFDGDQGIIVADHRLVKVAVPIREAYKDCLGANHEFVPPPMELEKIPESVYDCMLLLESLDSGGMGKATVLRDNLYNNGCTEDKLLAFFERVLQVAIARKEGALLADPFARMHVIAKECQIPLWQLRDRNGEWRTKGNVFLNVLRNNTTLERALELGMTNYTQPHAIIVSALRGIKLNPELLPKDAEYI